jgi:hypothetical protein
MSLDVRSIPLTSWRGRFSACEFLLEEEQPHPHLILPLARLIPASLRLIQSHPMTLLPTYFSITETSAVAA